MFDLDKCSGCYFIISWMGSILIDRPMSVYSACVLSPLDFAGNLFVCRLVCLPLET